MRVYSPDEVHAAPPWVPLAGAQVPLRHDAGMGRAPRADQAGAHAALRPALQRVQVWGRHPEAAAALARTLVGEYSKCCD